MSIGMTALFAGIAAFAMIWAMLAPTKAPWVAPDGFDDRRVIPGGETNPDSLFERYIRPTVRNFLPQTPMSAQMKARNNDKIVELLVRSGNPWNIQPEEFWGLRILAGVAGFFIALGYMFLYGEPPIPAPEPVFLALGAFCGQLYPKARLDGVKAKRQREARKQLPEALDLLVITISSGMNFHKGLAEVVERLPEGIIRDELARVSTDLRAGTPLEKALTDFARRAPSDEVEGFAKAIVISEKVGADVTETLRAQSTSARVAYEAALDVQINRLPTRLIIPVMVLFLPAMMVVLFAPAMANIGTVF